MPKHSPRSPGGSSPRSPTGGSPRVGSPHGASDPNGKNCWNWSDDESEGADSDASGALESAVKAKAAVKAKKEPLRSRICRCLRACCRRFTRCPKCRCCVKLFPCFYCCAPDHMLDRDFLIEQLTTASGGKAPSQNLVEETMAADGDRMAAHKQKWRSRWRVCSCCCCCSWLGALAALVVLFAISPWQQLCDDCGWSKRAYLGAALRPDGTIFVIGGRDGAQNFGDVWSRDQEGQWQRLLEVADFGARHGHAVLCARSGDLLLLGGDQGGLPGVQSVPKNDVWHSVDGQTWVLQSGSAPWTPRKLFGAVIDSADRLYITGGLGGHGSGGFNDLWASQDLGKTWQAVVLAAPWNGRHSFGLVRVPGGLQNGSLYLLGGYDGFAHHDVWLEDSDGWSLMRFTHRREGSYDVFESRAPWTPRFAMGAVADSTGRVKILGGQLQEEEGVEGLFSRRVWELPPPEAAPTNWWEKKTSDERLNVRTTPPEWILAAVPPWTARAGHAALIDLETDAVFIIGGEGPSGFLADAWKEALTIDMVNVYTTLELFFQEVISTL